MRKTLGLLLGALGALSLAFAGGNASRASNISYLVGTFLPGLDLLIGGLWVLQHHKGGSEK